MRFILSISSDIGTALAVNWLDSGINVSGTYRTWSPNCDLLRAKGAHLIPCDLGDSDSIHAAAKDVYEIEPWEVIVLAPGDQNPIGLFEDVNYDEWEKSFSVNFLKPIEFLHLVLDRRSTSRENLASVLMFAGGGTNSATSRYSAYTIAKIASIKIVELLDFEIPDCKFSIIGPGWVESKIHEATIKAEIRAGANYEKTKRMRSENLMNPVENVISACNWIISQPKNIVGGRNFSAVYDDFLSYELTVKLAEDFDFFKLRRLGNGIYEI